MKHYFMNLERVDFNPYGGARFRFNLDYAIELVDPEKNLDVMIYDVVVEIRDRYLENEVVLIGYQGEKRVVLAFDLDTLSHRQMEYLMDPQGNYIFDSLATLWKKDFVIWDEEMIRMEGLDKKI